MAVIIAGQNIQKRSTSKFPTQYNSPANTTATMIIHPIQIPAMATSDKPPLSVSFLSAWPQFGSSSVNKKGSESALSYRNNVRAVHLKYTTLVQHTVCYSYLIQLKSVNSKLVFSDYIPRYPSLPSTLFPLSCLKTLYCLELFFASPLRVGDGGILTLSNVISWSLIHG